MTLLDIYTGRQNWADYLRSHEAPDPDEADFDLLMGDSLWRTELAQESLNELLDEVRLPEFEREARAYRTATPGWGEVPAPYSLLGATWRIRGSAASRACFRV